MFNVNHFDSEWYVGIVEHNGGHYLATPPFESFIPSPRPFQFESSISMMKSESEALSFLKNEFFVANLNRLSDLRTRFSHSSIATLTKQSLVSKLIKDIERDLSSGKINEHDLSALYAIHLSLGVGSNKTRGIMRTLSLIDKDKAFSIEKKLSREPELWQENIQEIIDYVKEVLIPEQRFEEAHKTLGSIKTFGPNMSESVEDEINELLYQTKGKLIAISKENGESFAKPWQKFIDPEMTMNRKGPMHSNKDD